MFFFFCSPVELVGALQSTFFSGWGGGDNLLCFSFPFDGTIRRTRGPSNRGLFTNPSLPPPAHVFDLFIAMQAFSPSTHLVDQGLNFAGLRPLGILFHPFYPSRSDLRIYRIAAKIWVVQAGYQLNHQSTG